MSNREQHSEPPQNVAETMRDVMRETGHHDKVDTPETPDFTKSHLVTIPAHRVVQNVTKDVRGPAEFFKPARRTGVARMADLDSLVAWANRFKGDTSVLYASPDLSEPALTCIADYHDKGPADVTRKEGDPTARHCHHRAIYDFPLSDDWTAWMNVTDRGLEKDVLGEFIETQARNIMDPTPALLDGKINDKNADWENRLIETAQKIEGRYGQLSQLLSMSRSFQVHETSNLTVKTNRDTGEQEIQFLNEHKDADGKPLKIPNLIIIAIPVFRNGALYRMPVRFRYRKSGSSVKFVLSVYNPEKAFEAAFNEAAVKAQTDTELPLFLGKPEV
jgi:hypothetical protein